MIVDRVLLSSGGTYMLFGSVWIYFISIRFNRSESPKSLCTEHPKHHCEQRPPRDLNMRIATQAPKWHHTIEQRMMCKKNQKTIHLIRTSVTWCAQSLLPTVATEKLFFRFPEACCNLTSLAGYLLYLYHLYLMTKTEFTLLRIEIIWNLKHSTSTWMTLGLKKSAQALQTKELKSHNHSICNSVYSVWSKLPAVLSIGPETEPSICASAR